MHAFASSRCGLAIGSSHNVGTRSVVRAAPAAACCPHAPVIKLAVCPGAAARCSAGACQSLASANSRARHRVACSASASPSGAGAAQPDEQPGESRGSGLVMWGVGLAAGVAAVAALLAANPGHAATFKEALIEGPLGRSGFLAAFSLIFLSEIGDKTFFIAALLAMRLGRAVSFVGSVAALSVMTVISVGIGAACSKVPDALKSSVPIGEIAGVILLVVFGIRALREAAKPADVESASESELADAQEVLQEAESTGKVSTDGRDAGKLASLAQVATLIFLAEWGDRSMLATIALGAAQNPVGVAVGATVGHCIATAIAVVGGGIAGKHISERGINLASGLLFLIFAAATVYTML